MGKQTVLASLVHAWALANPSSEGAGVRSVGWIDASSVYGDLIKFDLFMNTVTQAHTGTRTGAPLFDAINNIHTNNTKRTTIEIKYQSITAVQGTQQNPGHFAPPNAYISIEIDWEALRVKWSGAMFTGTQFGNAILQGNEPINALGSTIEMQSWSPDAGRGNPIGYTQFVYLETRADRKLVKLPLFLLSGGSSRFHSQNAQNMASYAITTDDGTTVVAAPEPPAADVITVTQEVSGIKISELDAADSLSDTDLFVLSRDDPASGPYDKSLNVTLEALTTNISATTNLSSRAVRGYIGGDFIGSDGTGSKTITSSDSVTLGAQTYKVLAGFNAWLSANTITVTVELQYELNGSGTWIKFADLKTTKNRTGSSGHGYLWTVSPMGITELVAPSAGSYKFRMDANSPTLVIHDFSVIVL